jgi:hypothetical protein
MEKFNVTNWREREKKTVELNKNTNNITLSNMLIIFDNPEEIA